MSYQVLARKWRPATFEQMVGQSHVLHALTNALTQQRLHHAYLFSGTRGVGKTSLARLFAKGLNCEQGVTATPCGQCSACVEIAQGRFVDLIEVDAASRTKVDDTRELLDNVQYRPSRGRYKVYLIDEVHMLSRSSFNALLKTLEEPPEHVKFLLATTDPQRLPVTVLSRCLQFNLKSLTQEEIGEQLSTVLSAESLPFDIQALQLLAKAANGSMRDALSLTDQAIAFGAGQVKLELVQTMLGSVDDQHVIALLAALVQADVMALMQVNARVLSYGAEPEEVLRSLLGLLHQITLTQFAPAAAQLSLYSEQIQAFSQQLSPEQVQLYYQLLLTGRKDLPHAPDPKSGLEMALLRAVTFVPEQPVRRWENDAPVTLTLPPITTKAAADTATCDEPSAAVTSSVEVSSMHSEMAVIMSQAQSQGYVDDKPDLPEQAADNHKASKGSVAVQSESVSTPHVTPPKPEITHAEPQAEPVNTERLAEHRTDDSNDLLAYSQYAGAYNNEDVSHHRDDEAQQLAAPQSTAQATVETIEVTGQQTVTAGSTADAAVDLSDDILDAVLAARDSLLDGLGGSEPEESAAKKPVAERQPLKPMVRQAPIAPVEATHDEHLSVKPEEAVAQTVDRPPWEAPHPQDPCPRFADATAADSAPPSPVDTGGVLTEDVKPQHAPLPEKTVAIEADEIPLPERPSAELTGHETDLKWYRFMAELDVGGRVRQLAVNAICHDFGQPLVLLLKPDQKHLSAEIAIKQLEEAMALALGQHCEVQINIGLDNTRETPLEVRRRFHKELLAQAHHGLMVDDNVRWLTHNMGAKLTEDSLSYAPERLISKGQQIELVDMSSFKR